MAYNYEVTLQDSATATGNGTAMVLEGIAFVSLQVEGLTASTITFEGTIDASTWYAVQTVNLNDGSRSTTTTSDGLFMIATAGLEQLRARISAYGGGDTITVSGVGILKGALPPAAIPAGENHLGSVAGNSVVVDLTLSLDTSAYAAGDVLAEVQELAGALRVAGGSGIIHSLVVVDKDDQGQPLDVVFFDASASLGTENSAVSISDADAAKILGIVEVTSADYVDLVNSQVASETALNIIAEVSSGTSLYVGAISRGTGTYTASGIVLRVGILQD